MNNKTVAGALLIASFFALFVTPCAFADEESPTEDASANVQMQAVAVQGIDTATQAQASTFQDTDTEDFQTSLISEITPPGKKNSEETIDDAGPDTILAASNSGLSITQNESIEAPATVNGNQAVLSEKETETKTITVETQDMYRLYNPNSGEHFYTASGLERDYLDSVGWNYEGVGWTAPVTSDFPVYRLYNPNAGDHHYTLSAFERDHLSSVGWNYEGVGWYSAASSEGIPIYRQYNPNAEAGAHNFTSSTMENQFLVSVGWNYESVAWYSLSSYSKTVEETKTTPIATAPFLTATFTALENTVPESIVSYAKDDTTYLFFPSYTPLAKIALKASNASGSQAPLFLYNKGNYTQVDPSATVDVTALGARIDENGSYHLSFRNSASGYTFPLVIMKSANIAALYLNSADISSKGRAYVEASPDHSAKADVAAYMVNAAGKAVYNSDNISSKALSSIKGRGNTTWGSGVKKPYQISLNKKGDLLENGEKAKKWILLANEGDPSLIRSSIAFDLAREIGLDDIESRPIDLYYDGEYRGSYLLVEKIQINAGRVDIADLEDAIEAANEGRNLDSLPTATARNRFGNEFQYVTNVNDPGNITGGYLLELDNAYYKSEKCWFTATWPTSTTQMHFAVKSPEIASINAIRYISEAFQTALNSLAADQVNLSNAFSFDLDSFAKMYLVEEFLKNADLYVSSTYFYLDANSTTIMSGPVWDFDTCIGTRKDSSNTLQSTYNGIYDNLPEGSLLSSRVASRIAELYRSSFATLIANVVLGNSSAKGSNEALRSIDFYASEIAASQRMNEIPFGVSSLGVSAKPFSSWDKNVEYVKRWISWRLAWFNNNYTRVSSSAFTNDPHVLDGFDYGRVFDYQYYMEQNPDIAANYGYGNPEAVLMHFIIHGMAEGRTSSRGFDVNAYRANNPDLVRVLGDNIAAYYLNYCTDGFKQGRVAWA